MPPLLPAALMVMEMVGCAPHLASRPLAQPGPWHRTELEIGLLLLLRRLPVLQKQHLVLPAARLHGLPHRVLVAPALPRLAHV